MTPCFVVKKYKQSTQHRNTSCMMVCATYVFEWDGFKPLKICNGTFEWLYFQFISDF